MDVSHTFAEEGDGAGGKTVGGTKRSVRRWPDQSETESRRMDPQATGEIHIEWTQGNNNQSEWLSNEYTHTHARQLIHANIKTVSTFRYHIGHIPSRVQFIGDIVGGCNNQSVGF